MTTIYDTDREIQQAELALGYDENGTYGEDIYTSAKSRSDRR